MAPYFIVLILSTGLAALPGRITPPERNAAEGADFSSRFSFSEVMAVFILIVFSAVRYGIGTDYPVYASLYRGLDTSDWARSISDAPQEVGYTVFALATKSLFADPQAIFWTTSFVTVALAAWALKHLQGSFVFALFLYVALAYYVSPFNLVRQGMALSFIMVAAHVFDSSRSRFVVLVALAASVHISALAFGVGFLLTRRLKPSLWLVGASLGAGVIFAAILSIIPNIEALLNGLNPRYYAYLEVAYTGTGLYLSLLFKLAIVVYILVLSRGSEVNLHYQVLAVVSLGLMVVGTNFKYLARVESFFGVFLVLAAVEAVSKSRKPEVHMLLLGAASIAYFITYLSNYGGLVPYQTVWSIK